MFEHSPSNHGRAERLVARRVATEADPGRAAVRDCRHSFADAVCLLAKSRERIARGERGFPHGEPEMTTAECVLADWQDIRAGVRDVVLEFAWSQRALRTPAEGMLNLIKSAASDAGVAMLREPERSVVLADVVHWSIEGYYAQTVK
jgi:hypothetical protein